MVVRGRQCDYWQPIKDEGPTKIINVTSAHPAVIKPDCSVTTPDSPMNTEHGTYTNETHFALLWKAGGPWKGSQCDVSSIQGKVI